MDIYTKAKEKIALLSRSTAAIMPKEGIGNFLGQSIRGLSGGDRESDWNAVYVAAVVRSRDNDDGQRRTSSPSLNNICLG